MFNRDLLKHVPLTLDEEGTIRVTGTRVTLDVVVRQFKLGASPEHICESFPSLSLRDVYGALFFYLENIDQVEQYLLQNLEESARLRHQIEGSPFLGNSPGLRERLMARSAHLQPTPDSLIP